MSRHISLRDFDWTLLGVVLLICGLGVMEIYSASASTKFAGVHVKQIYWVLAGVVVLFLASLVNYQLLLENTHWFYLGAVVSLVLVLVFGQKYLGARRWILLPGGQHFQPSEWVKLILILAVAKYLKDVRQKELSVGDIVKLGAIVCVPMLLVQKQPDLGTSLTYFPVLVMGLFLGGMRMKHAASLMVMAAVLMPAVWFFGLKDYQKARLTSFANPEDDPRGSGYQVQQSLIAVGSGGIWGKGFRQGTQTQGMFLPVTHTDFAFAAFAEEQGLVGALGALLLYFMVLMRLLQNGQTAPDRGGAFIIMGVVAVLAFHILVNVGMVVGFLPVTGIPLLLFSYGGSSMLFTFLALGVVMNIRMRRFVN
ncbi:MAG: rod shape-determining protein RodA [Acidobacteria bacterium]|nr:rod shape-determining protein RodA [Acidobacteriota bacterium]